MKYYELNKEEEKILEDLERGRLVSSGDLQKEKGLYIQYAEATLNKARNINLRLSEKDLQKLKAKAAREGIPYQTLASSILHQFASK